LSPSGKTPLLYPPPAAGPGLWDALERAMANGVQMLAYRCRVTLDAVTLEEEISVFF